MAWHLETQEVCGRGFYFGFLYTTHSIADRKYRGIKEIFGGGGNFNIFVFVIRRSLCKYEHTSPTHTHTFMHSNVFKSNMKRDALFLF